ncbi:uncharacterized protein BDV17DRAFT_257047 [Aspergillus undulatus]|uniref:uncharacterized protein n=1 Tax=Aspergillus undulatus TaxID=1810928 RepID=UPI003CCD1F3F
MNNPTTTVAAATLALSQSNPQSSSNTISTPAAPQVQVQMQAPSQFQVPTATSQQPQQVQLQQHHQQPLVHDTTQSQSHPTLYPHQISGDGGPTATAPFLRDFSLVAEAAKRAQVAIVTRDLEGVSL